MQQILEGAVRRRKEVGDGPAVGRVERTLFGEVVDEVAVPEVGRDPAGGGVRLHEIAVVLEHGHVVADGGARHTQPG